MVINLCTNQPSAGSAVRARDTLVAFGSRFGVHSKNGSWVVGMRLISKRVAWLSLMLTLWSALAFAMHHHSNADESASCQVCIAAHSAAPVIASPTPKPIFRRLVAFRPRAAVAKQPLIAFALCARPPPGV